MEKPIDWGALWRQLVEMHESLRSAEEAVDPWRGRARGYAERIRCQAARPDPIGDLLTTSVGPADTVLDIGAGTGRWAVPLARRARRVTALDPSPSMLEELRATLGALDLTNVDIVEGAWPLTTVEAHDVTLCSHAMYGSPDLETFVRRMVEVTRRRCYLLIRAPTADGVMAEAATRVWGQPNDSPNFVVAYNVLLELGLRPNVLFDPHLWDPWTSPSIDSALAEIKRRLGIAESSGHDAYLRDLLHRRLTPSAIEGGVVWPRAIQSALVYWDVRG
jgi:SAM-dependent methyltransferase